MSTSNICAKQEVAELIKDEPACDADDVKVDGSYRPRPELPKPQVILRSLAELMKDLEDGRIDINPEYQREVVWTADRMTGLINSLMENFYIPPIILNGRKANLDSGRRKAGVTTFTCVDGKQRLSSVQAFIKGTIPCHDHRGEKWWFSNKGGQRHKVLPEATQKEFLSKDFVAYHFEELSQEQEEDLFARVQMGMQLSAAEKMRASSGPWQELAKLFVDDFPSVYALMKDRARAKDFQLTLSCFSQIVEVMDPTNGLPALRTNFAALPKFISNKHLIDDGIKAHLAGIWNTLKELIELDPDTFTNANKYLTGVQTFAPVEMVGVTVLLSMYSESRSSTLLLGDVQALRTELRKQFIDLRLNVPTWKFMWEFCDGLRGAVNGSTIDRRPMSSATGPTPSLASAVPSVEVLSSKKKVRTKKKSRDESGQIQQPHPVPTIPGHSTRQESQEAPLPTPSQGRRKRSSELHGNYTNHAKLAVQPPFFATSVPADLAVETSRASASTLQPLEINHPQSRIGIGAFTPATIEQQWAGIVSSISPQISPQTAPSTSSWPHSGQRKRKSTTHLPPAHYRDMVDLTGEDGDGGECVEQKRVKSERHERERIEMERRDLLLSFKDKSVAGKRSPAVSTHTPS